MSTTPPPRPVAAAESPPVPPTTVIAIDGPAGSGKSTTARALARRFDLLYVDTGAMYRALTWAALEAGIAPTDGEALAALLRQARVELRSGGEEARVLWDGHDVSAQVRTPAVETAVSTVSAHGSVRRLMVERQRTLGRDGGVVMEGRDIGSAVFPLADAKLYLEASAAARAERRLRQHRRRGVAINPASVLADLEARDRQDAGRLESPLVISPDAVVLETSDWSLEQQVEQAAAAVRTVLTERRPSPPSPDSAVGRLPGRYRLAYALFGALARFYGLRLIGREHLDLPGGTIIAPNHISWWDPALFGSTIRRGSVHALAKAELFSSPLTNALFRFLETIPIRRSGYDAQAFQTACDRLAEGHDVIIFPEGTRRPVGRPGQIRSGLGILMQRSGAPVVPAFIRGTRGLRPGGSPDSPLEVRFAPAIRLRALAPLRARYDDRQISARIGALFQAVYEELQARSYAEHPRTAWEIAEGERGAKTCAARDAVLFARRDAKRAAPGAT